MWQKAAFKECLELKGLCRTYVLEAGLLFIVADSISKLMFAAALLVKPQALHRRLRGRWDRFFDI